MGDVNGWELTEQIRLHDQRVPVVFITGWGLQEAEQERLRALRIHQCLFKPVHPAQLDAAVQDAL
jgi:response regulator RpfG family c-di-GMP phosphodiesterase